MAWECAWPHFVRCHPCDPTLCGAAPKDYTSSFTVSTVCCIVSVLGGDEGYTAKYGLNPREFPRAQSEGAPEGSGHILLLILS